MLGDCRPIGCGELLGIEQPLAVETRNLLQLLGETAGGGSDRSRLRGVMDDDLWSFASEILRCNSRQRLAVEHLL